MSAEYCYVPLYFFLLFEIEKKDYSCMEFNLQFCMLKLVWFCFFLEKLLKYSWKSSWTLNQVSRNKYGTNILEIFHDDRDKTAIVRQKWSICNFQEKIDRPIGQVFFWVDGQYFLSKPAIFLGANGPYHLGFLF